MKEFSCLVAGDEVLEGRSQSSTTFLTTNELPDTDATRYSPNSIVPMFADGCRGSCAMHKAIL